MQPSDEVLEALAVTAECCGRVISPAAAKVMCADLASFREEHILGALQRCRRELTGPLTTAAILSRIDDGRPDADEAWGMVPKDEASSAMLTEEMAEAMRQAMELHREGDHTGARMAFKSLYPKLVQRARDHRVDVKWFLSQGHDVGGRQACMEDAIERGLMAPKHAIAIGFRGDVPVSPKVRSALAGLLKIEGPADSEDKGDSS
jgi:hypothetical protein